MNTITRPPQQDELPFPDTGGPYTAEELQSFADAPFGRFGECVREHHDPLWGLASACPNLFDLDNKASVCKWAQEIEELRPSLAAQELSKLTPAARAHALSLFSGQEPYEHEGDCGCEEEDCTGGFTCTEELSWPTAEKRWLEEVRAHLSEISL